MATILLCVREWSTRVRDAGGVDLHRYTGRKGGSGIGRRRRWRRVSRLLARRVRACGGFRGGRVVGTVVFPVEVASMDVVIESDAQLDVLFELGGLRTNINESLLYILLEMLIEVKDLRGF